MGGISLLASYPKSGNTWLRAFLTSVWRDGADVKLNNLMVPSTSSRQLLEGLLGVSIGDLSACEIAALRPAAYEYARTQHAQSHSLVYKIHDALLAVDDQMPAPFQTESIRRVVYLVRDPRDVAPSLARHLGIGIDQAIEVMADPLYRLSYYPWRSGRHVAQLLSTWSAHVKSWTEADTGLATHVIRYEDMVRDPRSTFSSILEFLDIEASEGAVDLAIRATEIAVLKAKEGAAGFREKTSSQYQFFYRGQPGGWQQTLTREQVESIEATHRPTMQRYGYL